MFKRHRVAAAAIVLFAVIVVVLYWLRFPRDFVVDNAYVLKDGPRGSECQVDKVADVTYLNDQLRKLINNGQLRRSFTPYRPNLLISSAHLRVNFLATNVVIEQRENVEDSWAQWVAPKRGEWQMLEQWARDRLDIKEVGTNRDAPPKNE